MPKSNTTARVRAIAGLAIAAVGTVALVAAAYAHTKPNPDQGTAAPIPTFTLGVSTPTPTPSPSATETAPVIAPVATQRLLSVEAGAWWRGVAGECGGAQPLLERSIDGGVTWTDVTPLYLGVAQISALDSATQPEAQIIAGVGPACGAQTLRTFTRGQFWESDPDGFAASAFVDLADAALVQLPSGPASAPCADARGIRTVGDRVAVMCEGVAYVAGADAAWVALPVADAAAVAFDGDGVIVGHTQTGCGGLALTRYAADDPAQPGPTQCVDGADPTTPIAVAVSPDGDVVVWAGEAVVVVP